MLFSATLDGDVDVVVRRYLKDPVRHEVEGSEETVEEMFHRFLAVHQLDRIKVVGAIAAGSFRTIVFVRTKRGADRLVDQLRKEDVRALAFHQCQRFLVVSCDGREKKFFVFADGIGWISFRFR